MDQGDTQNNFYVINMTRESKRGGGRKRAQSRRGKEEFNPYVRKLKNLRSKYRPRTATVSIISEKSRSMKANRPSSGFGERNSRKSTYSKNPKASSIVNINKDNVIDLRGLGEHEIFNSFNNTGKNINRENNESDSQSTYKRART